MNSQKLEVDVKLLQELVNYLQTKPFVEVAGLINALTSIKKKENPINE
jgi:hypothetical protein